VAYENNDKKIESIYSKRIRAGKRRTYFFDVRATRGNDYYLTITESRKRFDDNGYDRHKIFLPDFNFDAFNHDEVPEESNNENNIVAEQVSVEEKPAAESAPVAEASSVENKAAEDVDKW
jgi:spore maturation protein CgeB